MAKLSNKIRRQLDNENPKLTVLLEDVFKKPVPDEALRQVIAQDFIDKILERTEESKFLKTRGNGKESALRYSGAYVSSIDFRIFGKSQGRVNLKASGDMLRAIDLTDSDESKLEIGFDDIDDAKKAHGHITGSVGKMRDFFGLPERDVTDIKKRYQSRVDALNAGVFEGAERGVNEDNLKFLLRFFAEENNG